jgi:hypothetical protein
MTISKNVHDSKAHDRIDAIVRRQARFDKLMRQLKKEVKKSKKTR